MKITILDDYQGVALSMADWSEVHTLAEVRVCRELLTGEALQAARVADVLYLLVFMLADLVVLGSHSRRWR